MTSVAAPRTALHPMPRWGAVFREQLAVTGLAMWREGVLLLAFAAAAAWSTISGCLRIAERWRTSGTLAESDTTSLMLTEIGIEVFGPGAVALLAIAALFLPAAVWRGASADRREYLSAMPLPAAPHALAKVAAGWTWAMVGVAVFSLGMVAVAAVAVQLLGDAPVTVHPRGRSSGAWVWLVPFGAVTVTYLIGSAFALAARHPWRLVLLAFVGTIVFVWGSSLVVGARALSPLATLFTGELGLNAAIAGVAFIQRTFESDGAMITTVIMVPDFESWLPALLLWLSMALGAMIVAAYRRRD